MMWWRRHHCDLPPNSDQDGPAFVVVFTCGECGQRWEETWASDVIEPTIAQPIDIGVWVWRKVDPAG